MRRKWEQLRSDAFAEETMTEKLMDVPIEDNVIKRYGKYTRKVNGELVKVVYDWFERDTGSKYKLEITRDQYKEMKSLVRDEGANRLTFDQFCDVLIPALTGSESDQHDDYSIWLAFHALDLNGDELISVAELETFISILGKCSDRARVRFFVNRLDEERHGHFDFRQFRQFVVRGYARELLMENITREIVY